MFAWQFERRLPIEKWSFIAQATLLLLLITSAYTDLRYRIIPNWATYTAFAWALAIAGVAGQPAGELPGEALSLSGAAPHLPVSFAGSLSGAAVCFLIMVVIHSVSRGGAGDVKLATAVGALVGVKLGILTICYTLVLAGVAALAIVIWQMGAWFIVSSLARLIGSFFLPMYVQRPTDDQSLVLQRSLPLAAFLALGTLAAILDLPGLIP